MNLADVDKIDSKTREQAWKIALSKEWTAEDWKAFYQGVTAAFVVISGRLAKQKIWEFDNDVKVIDKGQS